LVRGKNDWSLEEVRQNQKEFYGPNVDPDKYEGDLGNFMYFLCLIGMSLIPLEIFLKDLIVSRIENPIIISL
jgi:hypothetical protein